jgi:transposase
MRLYWLRDDQWELIKGLLPGKSSDRGVTARDNSLFVETVLWVARIASCWQQTSAEMRFLAFKTLYR